MHRSEKNKDKVAEYCKLSPIASELKTTPLIKVCDGYSVLTFLSSVSVLEKKIAMEKWRNTPNSCLVDNVKNEIIEWHNP